jgi:hypothetical protein
MPSGQGDLRRVRQRRRQAHFRDEFAQIARRLPTNRYSRPEKTRI